MIYISALLSIKNYKMKKIIALSLLVIVGTNGFCQNKKSNKKTTTETNQSAATLTKAPEAEAATTSPEATPSAPVAAFTEDQKNKLKEINKEFKAAKAKIEGDTTLSAEQKQSQIKTASKLKSAKMKEVFTPEQLAQIKQNHKKKSEDK